MALDKGIKNGKEHRKEYFKLCEQIDKTCRCNGGCEWCRDNRLYKFKKKEQKMLDRLKDYDV